MIYETIHCDTADQFVEYLCLSHLRWRGTNNSKDLLGNRKWIFRGQGDSTYKIIPSAWRWQENKEENKLLKDLFIALQEKTYTDLADLPTRHTRDIPSTCKEKNICYDTANKLICQIFMEMYLIQRFTILSNKAGLNIAKEEPFGDKFYNDLSMNTSHPYEPYATIFENFLQWFLQWKDPLKDFHQNKNFDHYFSEYYDKYSIAYAQHYNVPTRFIDFTYNPWKAAFFAAHQSKSTSEEIAVFCINPDMFSDHPRCLLGHMESLVSFVSNFKLSSFDFLRAQEGLFLVLNNANLFFYKNKYWPDLDSYLRSSLQEIPHIQEELQKNYRKVTLNSNEVNELTKILDIHEINETTMMPAYTSIFPHLRHLLTT